MMEHWGGQSISCEDPITTGIHSNTPDNNSYKLQTSWYYRQTPVSDMALFSSRDNSLHFHAYQLQAQGIIVVIVFRQCSLFAFLMNIRSLSQFIIVQLSVFSVPRLACASLWTPLTPSSGNQGHSGSAQESSASDDLVTRGRARGRHQGLIEYLYWQLLSSYQNFLLFLLLSFSWLCSIVSEEMSARRIWFICRVIFIMQCYHW